MIKEITKKIYDKYDSLNSKTKLLISFAILIVLIILVRLISQVDFEDKILEYSWQSGEELTSSLTLNYEEDIYLYSYDIVKKLIQTAREEYSIDGNEVDINDWYEYTLFSEYDISKSDFKKTVESINSDFTNALTSYGSSDLLYSSIIEEIYLYSKAYELYVVKLNIGGNYHYIGLQYTLDDTFYIFYIE